MREKNSSYETASPPSTPWFDRRGIRFAPALLVCTALSLGAVGVAVGVEESSPTRLAVAQTPPLDDAGDEAENAAASDLPSAQPVAPQGPEVRKVLDLLAAQDTFTPGPPSDRNQAAPGIPGDRGPQELNPRAVAAVTAAASGSARAEVLAGFAEFEHQGWEQRGTPTVVGSPTQAPLSVTEGKAVRITVCLDQSNVTIVDRDGNVIRAAEPGRQALHNYDLVLRPGAPWQVVGHSFPDDPTC